MSFFGGYVLLYAGGNAARGEIARIRVEARKTGMPLEASQLGPKPVPPQLNAAPLCLQADDMAQTYSDMEAALVRGEDAGAGPVDVLTAYVAVGEMQPYFDLLSRIAARPDCYFRKDWSLGAKVLFQEFAGMRRDVKDLCFKADLLDRSGDSAGAVKTLGAAYKIACDEGTEPVTISLLVELASRAIVNKEWERVLSRHSRDSKCLTMIEDSIKGQGELPAMKPYLTGEIVLGRRTIESNTSLADLGVHDDGSPRLEQDLMSSRLMKSAVEAKFLENWSNLWASLPSDPNDWLGYSVALRRFDGDVQRDGSLSNKLSQMIMPMFSGAADEIGVLSAHQRMLRTFISLAKIRNRTGQYPIVLPVELASTAVDPFDGNLLRYKRNGTGVTLYSIGADRVDNGGVTSAEQRGSPGQFDEVVSIR